MPFGVKEDIEQNFELLLNIKIGLTQFETRKKRENTKSIIKQRLRKINKELVDENLILLWYNLKYKLKTVKKQKKVLFYTNSNIDFNHNEPKEVFLNNKVEISVHEKPENVFESNNCCFNQWRNLYSEFKNLERSQEKTFEELIYEANIEEVKSNILRNCSKQKEIYKELKKIRFV